MGSTGPKGWRRGQGGVPAESADWRENERATGSGELFSAQLIQVELKRNWPSGGKSGGKRQALNPSQMARAKPCSVALRAQS